MTMPVEFDATWVPHDRFSIFRFGAAISELAHIPSHALTYHRPWRTPQGLPGHRDLYWCEDLDLHVHALDGEIHEFGTSTVCLFNGYNLIGCRSDVALAILGHPPVKWIDEAGEGLESYGHIESMGLILEVPTRTNAVAYLQALSSPEDRAAREHRAQLSNISGDVAPRNSLARWWRPYLRPTAFDQ